MKRSYYSLLALLAAGNGFSAMAQQKDSTLVREMTIEKEYNPIVREADKITRMPAVETPQTNKTKIEYAEPTLEATTKREVQTLEVGAVNTSYPFSKKRGYLDIAGGNYLNLRGDFGYRFIDKEKDLFGIELHHNSSNGKIGFPEDSWAKTKRKINDNSANLYYHHRFENLLLKTNVAYDYSGFNYYGEGDFDETYPHAVFEEYPVTHPDQTQQRVSLGFSLNTLHKQDWDYKMGFGFTGFSQKMPGINENEIAISLGLSRNSKSDWNFTTDLDVNVLAYGGKSVKYDWVTEGAFKNTGVVSIKPGMKYDNGSDFSARLGIRADMAFGVAPYVGIAPDFSMNWTMAEHWLLYGTLTGGIDQYSLSNLAKEHRYYYSLIQNRNSYTVADLELGIRSNAIAGFWFDIYGKLGYTKDDLFMESDVLALVAEEKTYWMNAINGFTANAFGWKIGTKMKYQFSNMLDLKLNLQFNGWNVSGDRVASYRPKYEIGMGATFRPIKKLTFDLNYDLKGGREAELSKMAVVAGTEPVTDAFVEKSVYKLKDIHQLNLKGDYRFNDTFALNASLNNLLFRKQEILYGMPEQGFHFMVGGSIRF
ncbi:MAG: TonB-dependent receptor [Bacteroidales bacterium]